MDTKELKNYIYENKYIEQVLESIGCHHIKYHSSGDYYSAGNPDGDNKSALIVYNNEYLNCVDYTRNIPVTGRSLDIIDVVSFFDHTNFIQSIKKIAGEVGISYYHDFNEDIPESFKILKMLSDMDSSVEKNEDKPLKPIDENILNYYRAYVNELFFDDGIDYQTQKEFEIGFDEFSNRYTIPIRSEIGDLIGVKGRYFYRDVPEDENKYIYLEPCAKSQILYGLYKTLSYIKRAGRVYVGEAEKFVMQCWSMGYRNVVSTCGKTISSKQVDLLVRLGVDIVFCFDKDVDKKEIEEIAEKFPENIPIYYMFDEDDILNKKESPSDDCNKWIQLVENNIYKVR